MTSIIAVLVRTSFLFDQALLFVFGLALSAPLGRLIFAGIFLLVSLFLGLVHSPAVVFGRAVDGDQLEGLVLAGVVELVFCARGNDDDIAGLDILGVSSHQCPGRRAG